MLTMISSGGRQHRLAPWMLLGGILVSGCAPIQSKPLGDKANAVGLVYYLPKRDIVVTLTKPATGTATLTVGLGDAYADLTEGYVLNVDGTPTASRDTTVNVSAAGLLESSAAKLESKVGLIAVELSKLAAQWKRERTPTEKAQPCDEFTAYTVSIDPKPGTSVSLCNLKITIAAEPAAITSVPPGGADANAARAGYYYRQGRPYRVQVCPLATNPASCSNIDNLVDEVVSSPTGAPVQFLPVSKAFFADSDSTVTFESGSLSEYKEVKGSELLGLTSIPANIISAYFTAASGLFDFINTKDEKEAEVLDGKLALKLAKMRYDACLVAIGNKDKPAIDSLGCNGGD